MADVLGVEALHAPLLYAQVVPYLVVGLDEAVGQVGVYLVAHHRPAEGLVLLPPPSDECGDGDAQLLASRLLHQLAPFTDVECGLIAPGADGDAAHLHLHGLAAVGAQQEVERRDVHGDGHIAVVGVYRGGDAGLYDVLRRRCAGGEECRVNSEEYHHQPYLIILYSPSVETSPNPSCRRGTDSSAGRTASPPPTGGVRGGHKTLGVRGGHKTLGVRGGHKTLGVRGGHKTLGVRGWLFMLIYHHISGVFSLSK